MRVAKADAVEVEQEHVLPVSPPWGVNMAVELGLPGGRSIDTEKGRILTFNRVSLLENPMGTSCVACEGCKIPLDLSTSTVALRLGLTMAPQGRMHGTQVNE